MGADNSKDSDDEASTSTTFEKDLHSSSKKVKSTLRFITWNIDGLDDSNLIPRTEAVCKIIFKKQADIVFLQELVPESAEYLRERLFDYHCFFGNEFGYFVGTFLKKSTVSYEGDEIIDFTTEMMRNCLKVKAVYKNKNLALFNSHLESTAAGAETRKVQLQQIFKEVLDCPQDTTAIFAGDLNSRDKELTSIGGLPDGIYDLWETCGSPMEFRYTFDLARNDNLDMDLDFKPRCRFDRVYIRHSYPRQLEPKYFGLIGLERVHPQRCFPSDHFGILNHFEVKHSDSS